MKKKVIIIGGITTDITGFPASKLMLRDSNIGRVVMSEGGVGRNIAENLARMGFLVELIAAMGEDIYASIHVERAREMHIGLSHAVTVKGGRSGVYLCLCDDKGDMFVALNDMDELFEKLTPERIDMRAVNEADLCVLDANLPEATLTYVAKNARVPVFADPVSVAKTKRLIDALPYLSGIKPNLMEALALTGQNTPEAAANALLRAGVKNVFLSLGAEGIYYANEDTRGVVEAERTLSVNATGAGDSATAALCAGFLTERSIEACARLAVRVGALTVQSETAVSEALSPEVLLENFV